MTAPGFVVVGTRGRRGRLMSRRSDPAAVPGTAIEKEAAFALAFRYLKTRIDNFIALPLERIDRRSLHTRLADIGRQEGASAKAGNP